MQILTDTTPPHMIGKVEPKAAFCDRVCVQDTSRTCPNQQPLCKDVQSCMSQESLKRKLRRWKAQGRHACEEVSAENDDLLDNAMSGLSPKEQRLKFYATHRARGFSLKYVAALWKKHPLVVAREEVRQMKKSAARDLRAFRKAQRLQRLKAKSADLANNSK